LGWIDDLQDEVVGLDTAPLIYLIEENPAYLRDVRAFFEALSEGRFLGVTSMVTLIEVLVHPYRQNNPELAAKYRQILLGASGLEVLPLSAGIAESAAKLRAAHNLRTPDAVQMATALDQKARFFLTNDSRLPSLPDLQVLLLDDLRRKGVVDI
jgi:predicted nucleic acid-binding protein